MSKKIKIYESLENQTRREHELTCVKAECISPADEEELNDRGCGDLKDYVVNIGGSCVVFYAKESGIEYLVKRITYNYGKDHTYEISHKMNQYCIKNNCNYFLSLLYIATDDEGNVYHVFNHVSGETPKYEPINDVDSLVKVLKEFKGFLFSLKMLHECFGDSYGYTHFDIKPQNIFKIASGGKGEYIMQVIDFGSAELSTDVQRSIIDKQREGYNYPYTEEWYTEADIEKYCKEIHDNRSLECINVLDLTAAVRVLSHFICGKKKLYFERDSWLDGLEGTCGMLREIEKKANRIKINKRYLSCKELMNDIDILIESLEGNIKTPKAMKIVSMNTRSKNFQNYIRCFDKYIADLRHEWRNNNPGRSVSLATIKNLKDSIDSNILVEICVNGKKDNSAFNECTFNQIEDICLNNRERNILLQGRAGGGKSTAIKKLYLDGLNLSKNTNNIMYLYLHGSDFENSKNVKNPILDILRDRYQNCSVRNFLNPKYNPINPIRGKRDSTKTKIYVLLDALDEIPLECMSNVCKEINSLNKGGIFFVITSRNTTAYNIDISSINCVKNSDPNEDSFKLLTDDQIRKEVGEVENEKILELIRIPMFMVIYKRIREQSKKNPSIIKIKNEKDLIDAYLKMILDSSKKKGHVKKHFMDDLLDYCSEGVSEDEIEEALGFIRDYRIEHIIGFEKKKPLEQDNGSNDTQNSERYTVVYSHRVYKDYFEEKIQSRSF